MSPRAALAVVGCLALEVALRAGALAGLPEMARLAVAFAGVVLLPGAAFVVMGLRPGGGAALAGVWALGFGVAWNAAWIMATRLAGLPFTLLLDTGWILTLLLWIAAAWWGRGAPRSEAAAAPAAPRLAGVALALVLAAAALAAVHAGRMGAPVSYFGDSPDHIGSIRRMLSSGDAFPTDAFFRDAGRAGVDPRKGLWHPQVALMAGIAGVDPADAWRRLPAVIAPFFVLNLAALGWLSAGGAGAALFAWVQLILLAGSLTWFPLRKAVFATFLADQLSLAVAIAVLADVAKPARAGRLAAVALALGAIACHVYASIQLTLTLGALIVGLALRERRVRGPAARAFGTALVAGLAGLPYLLWRAACTPAAVNVIHTEPQGLLWIGSTLRVVSVGVLWDWMSSLWVLFPLTWWWLARRGLRDPAALYAFTTSVAVTLVIFNPLAVAVLEPRVGYLLMRMIWMVPIGALLGWMILALARAGWARATPGGARARARVALAALLLFASPWARDAAATLFEPARFARADLDESPFRWREALAWMDRALPPGQVVLSDPATSYGVPMFTRHYVATLIDQHSSPSDSEARARILDARDALDPYESWDRTRAVIRSRGVTIVVVNSDFPRIPPLDYWAPGPSWAAAARARLDREPRAFERLYDRNGFTVYRVHPEVLDTLGSTPPPRPFVTPFVAGRGPVAHRFADDLPVIQRLVMWPLRVARGDTLSGMAEWRALAPLPGGSYMVSVRFEHPLPGGFSPPAPIAKPVRKVIERLRRERYRFRDDHLPTAGAYGVDLWRPDEVVRDSFRLVVPANAVAGYYRVEIRMNRSPHYPNFHLSDYFFERDYFSGVAMGEIEVAPSRAALAGPPAPRPAGSGESH